MYIKCVFNLHSIFINISVIWLMQTYLLRLKVRQKLTDRQRQKLKDRQRWRQTDRLSYRLKDTNGYRT